MAAASVETPLKIVSIPSPPELFEAGRKLMLAQLPDLSLFTPTHDPSHLLDAWGSLQLQQGVKWEWILVPNGRCRPEDIPEQIAKDPRVRVVPFTAADSPPASPWWRRTLDRLQHPLRQPEASAAPKVAIGALKLFACQQCRGRIFCELDHDDLLVPGVLQRVVELADRGAGFIFSDAANFLGEQDHEPFGYDERFGWESYELQAYGRTVKATRAFPVTARSLCEIYYAPDHIRCWTRDAYFKAGGHDPTLSVGDDHDLMIRTYLAKVPFAHTGTCGYLYRRHSGNTFRARQQDVIRQQTDNRDKYLWKLISEWCRRHSLDFLDLVQSERVIKDELGCLQIEPGQPFLQDIPDSSVGCVRAWGVVQFVPQELVPEFMNEVYRVLAPGGWLGMAAPSTDGRAAFAPPCRSWWNEFTFDFFTDSEHARMLPGLECRFQKVRCWTAFQDSSCKQRHLSYVYADLLALKGQRTPGWVGF